MFNFFFIYTNLLYFKYKFSEFPLSSLVSSKFSSYLLEPNISLYLQLDSITAENDQLTISTNIKWTDVSLKNESFDSNFFSTSSIMGRNFFDSEETLTVNSSPLLSTSVFESSFTKQNNNTGTIERLQIWVIIFFLTLLFI